MKRTPEQKLLNPRPGSKIAAARDFGIDLSLTAAQLRLSPQQRIDSLQASMKALAELDKARIAGPVVTRQQNMVDLEKAITSLAVNNVEYVIVGGVAVTLHSSGYLTRDFDFCYSREKANIQRLVMALAPFNPKPRNCPEGLPFIFDETTILGGTNFTFETSIGDIDMLGEVKGIGTYIDALAKSVEYEIYGFKVRAFTLDALITSKTAADRPKDHLVLPELFALKEALDPNEE